MTEQKSRKQRDSLIFDAYTLIRSSMKIYKYMHIIMKFYVFHWCKISCTEELIEGHPNENPSDASWSKLFLLSLGIFELFPFDILYNNFSFLKKILFFRKCINFATKKQNLMFLLAQRWISIAVDNSQGTISHHAC